MSHHSCKYSRIYIDSTIAHTLLEMFSQIFPRQDQTQPLYLVWIMLFYPIKCLWNTETFGSFSLCHLRIQNIVNCSFFDSRKTPTFRLHWLKRYKRYVLDLSKLYSIGSGHHSVNINLSNTRESSIVGR